MRIYVKLSGKLYREIIQDLMRPHPFARERVGFVMARTSDLAGGGHLVLVTCYHSIPDDHYLRDVTVGARIGSDAMAWAMEAAYQGRPAREGVLHVHLHDHEGPTGMSRTDRAEIPKLIPGFQSVSRAAAHGILILSRDHGSAWVWLPGNEQPCCADSIQVVGAPVRVFPGVQSEVAR